MQSTIIIVLFIILILKIMQWAREDGILEESQRLIFPREQGTFEERERRPNLNTNNWDQHWRRIKKYQSSMYKGEMYYMGPKGGYYTYSDNGNRVYK